MKPPICAVCGKDFASRKIFSDEGGDEVEFADFAPLPSNVGGHPRGVEWICDEHLPAALQLRVLPARTAIDEIRARLNVTFAVPTERAEALALPSLWLVGIGPDRTKVIMAVRQVLGCTPAEAKARVMSLPLVLASGWPNEFEGVRELLVAAGARTEIRYT